MAASQKLKIEFSMIQQFHYMVYMQKNRKQSLKNIFVCPYSQKHYSQCPKGGNNLKCLLAVELINKYDRAAMRQTLKTALRTQLVRVGGEGEGEMYGESNMETYITIYEIDSQWEFDSGNSNWGLVTI